MTDEPTQKPWWKRWPVILGVLSVLGMYALVWLWFEFHSIPRQNDLVHLLQSAEQVEIFRMQNGKPTRWIRLERPPEWRGLIDGLRYQGRYWAASVEPTDCIVVQTIRKGEREGVWDIRDDGHIHIRKSGHWHRMPIGPAFVDRVRETLAKRGEDLPADSPRAPTPGGVK